MDELQRPAWPYTVGAVGGAVFAAGALLLLYLVAASSRSDALAKGSFVLLAAGGAMLGVGWAGMFKYGQGGFGSIAGSFVVAIVIVYMYTNRGDADVVFFGGNLLLGSLALFALGHIFVKQTAIRVLSAVALISLAIEFAACNRHWHLSESLDKLLGAVALLGLALTGVALAFAMPPMRREDLSQPKL